MDANTPPAEPTPRGHEDSVAMPAPGDLEAVRSFLSLHDHIPGRAVSLAPSLASVERWLREHRLLRPGEPADDADLRWATSVHAALRATVPGIRSDASAATVGAVLDEAAVAAGLVPSFSLDRLVPGRDGVRSAVGTLLAMAFSARRDGTWDRLRGCANPACTGVFFDRSKNRSGRWCSMRSCGNQAKVRAYRDRQRTSGP